MTIEQTYARLMAKDPVQFLLRRYKKRCVNAHRVLLEGTAKPAKVARRYLDKRGIGIDVIKTFKLGCVGNLLYFPVFSLRGEIIGIVHRLVQPQQDLPAYEGPSNTAVCEKRRCLYGFRHSQKWIFKAGRVIIVEGPFDFLTLWQAGLKETVATLTSSLAPEQMWQISRYIGAIFVIFDGDEAGEQGKEKIKKRFGHLDIDWRFCNLPIEYDPDKFVCKFGIERFKKEVLLH